ncbi:MAG: ROK family protein [Bryocella sp.]
MDISSAQLASSELAREINRDIVLDLIRFKQPISRVALARLSGLQPSTVSLIVEGLIDEKWVTEGAVVQGSRGRPSVMLKVNEDLVTLALDLRPDRAFLAVIDLSGRFLAQEVLTTVSDPVASCKRIVATIRRILAQHPNKFFEGIGVSVPGRVAPGSQKIIMAPNLKWNHFDIKSALEKEFGLQVEIDNDANACLLSELWYGRLEGVSNAVLVAVSEGIGAAILAGGQIQSGHNGMAGEFGHIPIDPTGPKCECGQSGCWEIFASSRAALKSYQKLVRKSAVNDIRDLLRLAEEGDPIATEVVEGHAKYLGRGLRMVAAALAPELILLTGEITSNWAKFGPIVQKEFEAGALPGALTRLTTAGGEFSSRLSGAAAVLLQRHSMYHRSTHASRGRKPIASKSATKKALL